MKEAKVKKVRQKKDVWLKILKLLADMPKEERDRCIAATTVFFEGRPT